MINKILGKGNRQVVLLYFSTLAGVILGVLTSVINTRILSPELYGNVRYIQNIIAFISSLLLFGYFTSGSRLLALSKDEEYSRRIRGVMTLILGITVLILMSCITCFYLYTRNINNSINSLYAVAIPLCGNVLMLNYINTTAQGDNHIGRIAAARLIPPFLYIILAIIIYQQFDVTPELVLVLYNGSAILILAIIIFSTHPRFSRIKEIFNVLKEENRLYGFNVYLGALFGVSTQYISGITLGQFCENNVNVGFYTLALTISTPLMMLPAIIGTTNFKQFATEKKISSKTMFSSISLTIVSCLIFCLIIDYIVELLYDSSYKSVSIYAQWLAIGRCFHGLGDMINRYLGAHGQGKYIRNSAIACGLSTFIGSIVLVYYFKITGAIATSILSALIYLGMLAFYYNKYINRTKI